MVLASEYLLFVSSRITQHNSTCLPCFAALVRRSPKYVFLLDASLTYDNPCACHYSRHCVTDTGCEASGVIGFGLACVSPCLLVAKCILQET